jgi:hypothetical protein
MRSFGAKKALITLVILMVSVTVAGADEYGCKVLLCMSNPNGPKAVSECVPPINKLLSDMTKPNFSWPRCKAAEASGARIVPTNERHEPCPKDYAEIPEGVPAIKKADYDKATHPTQWINHSENKYLKWIYPLYFSTNGGNTDSSWRLPEGYVVCVRGGTGKTDIAKAYTDHEGEVKYRLYDNAVICDDIAFAKRINAAVVVDVYIDGKFYMRVPLNY